MVEKSMPSVLWLTLVGVVLLVFGGVAIASPAVAGTSVVLVVGAILIISGVVQIVHGVGAAAWSNKVLGLVLGMIALVGGMAVLAHPWLGLAALALVMAVYFAVEGIWKIIASFSFRPARGWLALLASGVVALLLAVMIGAQWPISGLWAVGVLVGVDLLMTGLAMLLLAWTVRQLAKTS